MRETRGRSEARPGDLDEDVLCSATEEAGRFSRRPASMGPALASESESEISKLVKDG
jgi:hypothetical protein